MTHPQISVAIIGAGPAGLTAAISSPRRGGNVPSPSSKRIHLCRGIARTAKYKGYHFEHRRASLLLEVEGRRRSLDRTFT